MFKSIILPILGVVAFISLVGYFYKNPQKINIPTPQKNVKIAEVDIPVELADTNEKRTNGLSGKSSLEKESGMLFVFEKKVVAPTFWMKDMLIPLDIIWIGNGKIVKIDKNVPAPVAETPDTKLVNYSPGTPIDYVLEVNAGFSDKNNFKVGDSVDLSGI
ncbi:MAG: DUF192 domain-containing protein [bacterium]|nr:DUF192 domain-containing protein [bacterium]